MQIQVTRVAVKAKVFDSGDTAWPVMHTDQQWYDIFSLNRKPEKGEVYECDVKVTTKDTPAGQRTYRNAYPKPSEKQVEKAKEVLKPVITATKLYPPPDPDPEPESKPEPKPFTQLTNVLPVNNIRTTSYTQSLNDYEKLINRGFELAGINGVTDDAARVSLVATLCIAFGDGKLSIDDLPMDAMDAPLPEELQTGEGWADREWFEGPMNDDAQKAAHEWADKKEMEAAKGVWTEAQQKKLEMEAAKARMDKFIQTPTSTSTEASAKVDYKTQLGAAIKTHCFNKKLDFKTNKFEVLWKCANTRQLESLSQEQAKEAIEKLKVLP